MSDLNDHQREQILDALKAGNKIEAIKLYREATGLGLKESKDFIDGLLEKLMKEQPELYAASSQGCAAVLALVSLSLTVCVVVGLLIALS